MQDLRELYLVTLQTRKTIVAIREVIRNAVIHRDYSLTGKDIKIAIFDDKVEITSPGKLMPSVDYNDMDSGQSDIRNKILAPVFKRIGIIEQWVMVCD